MTPAGLPECTRCGSIPEAFDRRSRLRLAGPPTINRRDSPVPGAVGSIVYYTSIHFTKMPERYTLIKSTPELSRLDWIDRVETDHEPRYGIAPGKSAPVVRRTRSDVNILARMRWGLVPSWADDPNIGHRLVHAWSERAYSEPAFQASFRHYRCLVPADGFLRTGSADGGAGRSWWIRRPDGSVFAMAGLWDQWAAGDVQFSSYAILTVPAGDRLPDVNGRVPAVLEGEALDAWLDRGADTEELRALFGSASCGPFEARPVSTYLADPDDPGPDSLKAGDD